MSTCVPAGAHHRAPASAHDAIPCCIPKRANAARLTGFWQLRRLTEAPCPRPCSLLRSPYEYLTIVLFGVALWGLHMGMTQGLLSALVADEAPANLRATAFGVFNFASGVALLLASLIAGALWEQIGPSATFVAGAAFTALGLLTLFRTRQANPVKWVSPSLT